MNDGSGTGVLGRLWEQLRAGTLWKHLHKNGANEPPIYPNRCERSPILEQKNFPVSVLVTNWNGEREIAAFLQSYYEHHQVDDAELVIVDHASSDESRECIRYWMKTLPIKLVCCDRNQRYAVANNLAHSYAEGDLLVFANNDLVFDGPVIPALRTAMQDPEVGLAGVNLYYPDADGARSRELQHQGIRFAPDSDLAFMRPYNIKTASQQEESYQETAAVTTALAACRRTDFEAVGGFFEDYDYGFEDVDLALQLRRQLDRKNVICTEVAAIHTEFGSQRRQSKRVLLARRQANALTFRDRHNRWLTRTVMRSQLSGSFCHRKPLQVRTPQSIDLALSDLELPKGDVELYSIDAGDRENHAGFCGIWLLDDPEELKSNPAPRGALAVALVNPGTAGDWEEMLGHHQLDLMICEGPGDQLALKEHGGTCLAQTDNEAHSKTPGWLDWLLETVVSHLAKPAIAIKAAMPDSSTSEQPDLELARELGRALRERGYRVRIDFPRQWESRRMYMDDVTVTLRGNERFRPEPGALNLLWLIDADHPASDDELNGFEHVFTISPSEASALELRLSSGVSALDRKIWKNPAAEVDRVIRDHITAG